jgi:chromosome segregation ATPase
MEFEQIIKRLDWLDEEHRKNKTALTDTKEQLDGLERENKTLRKKIKDVTTEMSRLATAAGRMEEFDTALTQHRKEVSLFIADMEKRREANQVEIDKRYRLEFDGINKPLIEIKKVKESIAEIKRELKGFTEEDVRRNRTLTEAKAKIEDMLRSTEEAQRSIRVADESRRQESKRVADLHGEISATRKRLDEIREKYDISSDGLRRMEVRLNEILASESERRQSQVSFVETQTRLQVDRDRTLKEWRERFDGLAKQSETLETQLQAWDSAQRAVKRAQETYEDITSKFERRINEITEIQRLAEDRFRQEWVTFKADDQKRWTSFSLSQEEIHKDNSADIKKINERVIAIEDLSQTQQDILQQTKEANEQMLQAILAQIHELLSAYERIMGSTK